jgi:hypothetical protein
MNTNCLQIPAGTASGVFTVIVLSRKNVQVFHSGQAELARFPVETKI